MDEPGRRTPPELVWDSSKTAPGNPPAWNHQDAADDGTGEETFWEEEPSLTADLQWMEELYEREDDDDLAVGAADGGKLNYAETARMFKLRRNLDQLDRSHQQTEHEVLKAREQLKICRRNIAGIERQRERAEREIEQQKEMEDSTTVCFLRAQHRRLCQELLGEEELEARINTALKAQELELNLLEVELGRSSPLRRKVREKEQLFEKQKDLAAVARLQQERNATKGLRRMRQNLKDTQADAQKKEETRCQKIMEDAEANQKKCAKYLKETMRRVRQQEAEKEQESQNLLQRRTRAVRSLRDNIAATHESIRTQQDRAKAVSQRKEQQEQLLMESLRAEGINSLRHIHQQKQLDDFQRKKEEFARRQESNRMEIVTKVLREEEQRRAKRALPSQAGPPEEARAAGWAREKVMRCLDPRPPKLPARQGTVVQKVRRESSSDSSPSSESSDAEDGQEEEQGVAEYLDEPEFSGLWDQDYKKNIKEMTVTKLEPDQAKPEVLPIPAGKSTMPSKRVACGKVLKGPPFTGKPEAIHFKDFEVGKTYKRKVVLTNISYTTCYCRLLGVSAQLTDSISIIFNPPGPVLPGMTCYMQAVFQPTVNRDLEGEVCFKSDVGPFSVPIRCVIKKCDLEVDSRLIDFGTHVVGQTISQTITLTNGGALGTRFSVDTSGPRGPEESHLATPPVSAQTLQEAGGQNESPDNQNKDESMGTRKPCSPKQSQEQAEASGPGAKAAVAAAGSDGDVSSAQAALPDQTDSDVADISFGEVREGELGPFDSVGLEVVFTPTVPGVAKLHFHIKFSDPDSEPIQIRVRGVAAVLPVQMAQPSVNLKICMFDHIYQDRLVVHNSASTALGLTFEVCPEMQNHMKILPKTGLIQPKSDFSAQLKFQPRSTLAEDAKEFFDGDTGVLEVPLNLHVTDQVWPVPYTVLAVVTTSDLQFDPTEVDFGYCSVFESVRTKVRLTNLSLLTQDFGFLGIPEFIEVQPNDGFGVLLPLETLEIDLIFNAKKAKDFRFQLHCKSGVDRDFLLPCRAVGVQPPLELSVSLIQFGATAIGDRSTAVLHVINPGSGPSAPGQRPDHQEGGWATAPVIGPRLFCFNPLDDSEISIAPSKGRLLPGERRLVQVTFKPRLSEQQIRDEALRLCSRAAELRRQGSERPNANKRIQSEEVRVESSNGKKSQPKQAASARSHKGTLALKTEEARAQPPKAPEIRAGGEEYEAGRASLLHSFTERLGHHVVPCFVSDGDPPPDDPHASPSWSPLNTLYLELLCPVVQPSLVVTSNNGQSTVDFGLVAAGQKAVKTLTIQNISKEPFHAKLGSSALDPSGCFSLLNALRRVSPGERHTLRMAFAPTVGGKYLEILDLRSPTMALPLTLRGDGVDIVVTSTPASGPWDFGYVLEHETASQVLQLHNTSSMEVRFRVLQASLSQTGAQANADSLRLLLSYPDPQVQRTVGTQNYSGLSVFSSTPIAGCMAPGARQDITVTFQPDHPSVNYSDRLTVELTTEAVVCVLDLRGAACSNTAYVCGGERLAVPIESLLPKPEPRSSEHPEPAVSEKPLLLTMRGGFDSVGGVRPAVRVLEVGCIRTSQPFKKSLEFHWDNLASLLQRGFSVEPSKGSVDAGHRRSILVKWTPPPGHKPYEVVEASGELTLKGDETEVYRVTLLAVASVADQPPAPWQPAEPHPHDAPERDGPGAH